MTSNFQLVQEFHEAFKQQPLASPRFNRDQLNDMLLFRNKLLEEEHAEGLVAGAMWEDGKLMNQEFLRQYIDSLTDMLYVIYGTFDLLGIDADAAFAEVHRSNMSKLDENGEPIINDGILNPDRPVGKILKGPNFSEPNLAPFAEQIMEDYIIEEPVDMDKLFEGTLLDVTPNEE